MPHNIINSVLQYGGVQIPFLRVEEFRQEPIWSNDGVDLLYTHITIAVSGVLNSCFLKDGMDPACWIESARPILLQRGHQLSLMISGTQVMPPPDPINPASVTPTTGNELVNSPGYANPTGCVSSTTLNPPLDSRLGPKPITLDIRHIQGGTYSIFYRIETWVPYCSSGTPGSILSNRWESTVTIGNDYFYTRTTNGVLVLNGQYLTNNPAPTILSSSTSGTPNSYLILPPMFKGWKREVVRFNLSSDQLTLTYSIEDRQQYVSIPRPAVTIDATYAEICPAPGHASQGALATMNIMQQNMDVTIYGDPNALVDNSYPTGNPVNPDQLKYLLMQIMFQLVFSRITNPIRITGDNLDGDLQMITHFELREDVMKPIVGCRVVAFRPRTQIGNPVGSATTWQSNAFAATSVGLPLYLDDMIAQVATQPISIGNWATYLLLSAVAPRDPCAGGLIPGIIGQNVGYNTAVYSSQTSSAHTSTGTGYTQTVNLAYSTANYNHPFTEYTATVDFITDNHTYQAPIMYDVEQGTTSGTQQASAAFFQTASPTTKKVIHWRASRLGVWPKAPRPDSVDTYGGSLPSDKVLNHVISPGEVELSNDGITRHYSISGMMEIGMARRVQWDVGSTVLSTICGPVIGSAIYGDKDSSFPTTTTASGSGGFVSGIVNSGSSPGAN